MSYTVGKAGLACLLGMLIILFSASQVSAQETGTLMVYEETQGEDAVFSFSGSGSVGNFQISTEGNGGAKVFDLTAGTYTVTQSNLPSGWNTQEVFCDGTGTTSTDLSQSKATFTVSSPADVIYLRFTNTKASTNPTPATSPTPSPSIPENIGLPLLLFIIAAVTCALVLLTKKKRTVAPAFAVLLSVLTIFAFVGQVQANPDKYIQLGTKGNDEQTQFGTPGKDVIVQLGFGGNDSQYAEGSAGDDIMVQNGGSGQDEQTIMTGSGNDFVVQEGGDGSDFMYIQLGTGDFEVTQNGGDGDDIMQMQGAGEGNSKIKVNGGAGNDKITVSGNNGYDLTSIDSGLGDDKIEYTASDGADSILIDGGLGDDFLSIYRNAKNFQVLDGSRTVLYSFGSGGSVITVLNVEHGQILGNDLKVAFEW